MANGDADSRSGAHGGASVSDRIGGESSPPARFGVEFAPHRLVAGLVVAVFFLLATHSALTVYHYEVEDLPWLPWRQLFDVDEENNLPTWFSGFVLSLAAFCLWLSARSARTRKDPATVYWYALALGFFVLSIDEVAGLHETVNSLTDINWAIPGGVVAAVAGLAFIPFLRRLPVPTALLFMAAGIVYVGGAVGVELVGEPMDSDTLLYNLTTVVEEGMEMGGVIVFLYALLGHMRHSAGSRIDIGVGVR